MSKVSESARSRQAILLFFAQIVLYSAVIYFARWRWPPGAQLGPLTWTPAVADFAQMGSVGVAGLVSEILAKGSLAAIGFQRLGLPYFAVAIATPMAYCTAIYAPCWLLQIAPFKGWATLLHGVLATFAHLPAHFVAATGEEIGWRGSATPNLSRWMNPSAAGLICGLAWAAWHYADIVFFGYNSGAPLPYALACFTIFVVGAAMFLTWLRLASDSVWPPAVYHGVHNAIIYGIFDRATSKTQIGALATTEFGLGMAVAGVVLGIAGLRALERKA